MSAKMREALIAYMAAGFGNSTDYEKQAYARRMAMEALAEQPAPSVPDGWKLVPVEPTEEMLEAGRRANALRDGNALGLAYIAPDSAYRAMLAAAPEPRP